jgi:NADH-quinone oxidoreductase subunit L
MRLPAILLSVGSLWLLVTWNPFDFKGWLLPRHPVSVHELSLNLLSGLWVAGAMLLSWMLFRGGNFRTSNVLRNAFYFDDACTWLTRNTVRRTSSTVRFVDKRVIDKGLHGMVYAQVTFSHILAGIDRIIIDGTVNAVARLVSLSGTLTRSFQGGNIQLYIFWAVFAIIIFIISSLN